MFEKEATKLATMPSAGMQAQQYIQPTKRQKLQQQKDVLEMHLQKINDALKALDDHPDLEKFINVIEKADL